ncbi:Rho guanine nucleotide exchange factor [Marasmius sp. AFHP31]|nr:Rho guanine nucleotide exchange factor [Marasmius sp. AFHP31]
MGNGQDISLPQGPRDARPALIAVIGTVGSGKTTFINLACGGGRQVAEDVGPCTKDIELSQIFQVGSDRQDVQLIDTPGFDETNRKDLGTTLGNIDRFLNTSSDQSQRLAGIIYLHRAVCNKDASRILPTERGQLRRLCGEDTLKKVVIVTNGWDEIPPETWDTRRDELRDVCFRDALDKGAIMSDHDNTCRKSANAIVNLFIEPKMERLLDVGTDLKDFMVELHIDNPPSPPSATSSYPETQRPIVTHPTVETFTTQPPINVAEEDADIDDTIRRIYAFFEDKKKCGSVLRLRDTQAQEWLDFLQGLLYRKGIKRRIRSTIFKVMLRLSKESGLCPKCLTISDVKKSGKRQVAGGGFGDVWMGEFRNRTVCLKLVRLFADTDIQKVVKEYMQEAMVWQQLEHPNLLPFIGLYRFDDEEGRMCLVSPWMEEGNLPAFLQKTKPEQASDVASGLNHLHDLKIVHSDLKGVNVLMTPELRACIADFGLSHLADSRALKLSTPDFTNRTMGTTRWLAPELLDPGKEESGVSTQKSDIYAYGCVCYEIFTGGHVPLYEKKDLVVHAAITSGEMPSRTKGLQQKQHDEIWKFMAICWSRDPSRRPSATKALEEIRSLERSRGVGEIKLASTWSSDHWKGRNVEESRLKYELLF